MTMEAVPVRVGAWIEISELASTLVLRLSGELDSGSRDSIEPAVTAAITTAGSVILDLADLRFCDSRGLAMFVAAHTQAEAEGTRFSLRNPRPIVRRLLEITGLDHQIDIID